MNTRIELTEDLLRDALRIERPVMEPFDLSSTISARLTVTRQRSRWGWPWASTLASTPSTSARLAWAGVWLLLLLAALVGVALIIGSLLRPPFPLAGKVVVSVNNQLLFIDPSTGVPSTELADGTQPTYSPDGRYLAYIVPNVRGLQVDIAGVDGRIERVVRLDPPAVPEGWLSWSPDASLLAFDADVAGESHVFLVNRDAGDPRDITPPNVQLSTPALSPDGRLMAVRALDAEGAAVSPPQWRLWFVDVPSGRVEQRIAPLADGYSALAGGWPAQWSPDGTRLVFDSRKFGGDSRMFVVAADGTRLQRIATDLKPYSPVWSPDGRSIAFDSFDTGPSHSDDAWMIDSATLVEREVFPDADVWAWSAAPGGVLYAAPSCASRFLGPPPQVCEENLFVDLMDRRGPHLLITSVQLTQAAGPGSGPGTGVQGGGWGRAP